MTIREDDWEKHWEEFSESSYLNPAQAYRRQLIIRQLKQHAYPILKILDIGSGQGDLIAEVAPLFPQAELFGIELSIKGVELSQKKLPSATFIQRDLLTPNLIVPTELLSGADIAICSEVLEHLDKPLVFLANVAKLLKPGATLIVTVPRGPRSAYDRHIGHRQHFRARDLNALLEAAGFTVKASFKAGFPFFNLYKMLVILRGKKLIADSAKKKIAFFGHFLANCFRVLFKLNLRHAPWGWQLVSIATKTPPVLTNL